MFHHGHYQNREQEDCFDVIESICSGGAWAGFQIALNDVGSVQAFIDKFTFGLPACVDFLVLLSESTVRDETLADGFQVLLNGTSNFRRLGEMRLKAILKLMNQDNPISFSEYFVVCFMNCHKKHEMTLKSYTQRFKKHLVQSGVDWIQIESWKDWQVKHKTYDMCHEKKVVTSPREGMWCPTLDNQVYFFNPEGNVLVTGNENTNKYCFVQTWVIHLLAMGERVIVFDSKGRYQKIVKCFQDIPSDQLSIVDVSQMDLAGLIQILDNQITHIVIEGIDELEMVFKLASKNKINMILVLDEQPEWSPGLQAQFQEEVYFNSDMLSSFVYSSKEKVSLHQFWVDPYLRLLLLDGWSKYSTIQAFCEEGLTLDEAVYEVVNDFTELAGC